MADREAVAAAREAERMDTEEPLRDARAEIAALRSWRVVWREEEEEEALFGGGELSC